MSVRLGVPSRTDLRGERRTRQELHFESLDHGRRELGLHLEDIGEIAIVLLRPEVVAVGGVDELGRDANAVAGLAHAAFQQRRYVQLGSDAREILVLPLEVEGRGPPHHIEAIDLSKRVEDLLGDPVGEVLLFLVRTEVDEREDGDGRHEFSGRLRRARRRLGDPAHEEVPDRAGSRREHADADEHQREAGAPQTTGSCSSRRPFDPAGFHVEDPGKTDDHREADRERRNDVRQHRVGPMQPVHDRFDDLEHRKRGDAVRDESAEHATAL